jgi:hypothetical protein
MPAQPKKIDKHHNQDKGQAAKLAGFFNPGPGGFHALRNVFGTVFGSPAENTGFIEKQVSRVTAEYE